MILQHFFIEISGLNFQESFKLNKNQKIYLQKIICQKLLNIFFQQRRMKKSEHILSSLLNLFNSNNRNVFKDVKQ
jgi:hypothetical protein